MRMIVSHALRGETIDAATAMQLDKIVRTIAFQIQGAAAKNAPVDTGALRASIFVNNSRGSGAGAAAAKANALISKAKLGKRQSSKAGGAVRYEGGRKIKRAAFLSAVPSAKMGEAYIAVGMEYGAPVEYTHPKDRYYLNRAMRRYEGTFRAKVREALQKRKRVGNG